MEKHQAIQSLSQEQTRILNELTKKLFDGGTKDPDTFQLLYRLSTTSWRLGYCEALELCQKGKNEDFFDGILKLQE